MIRQQFSAGDKAEADIKAQAAAAYLGPNYRLADVTASGDDGGTWVAHYEKLEPAADDGAIVGSAEERT